MAYAFVQDKVANGFATFATTYSTSPTPGNLLLCTVNNGSNSTVPTVSDTLNGNWTLIAQAIRSTTNSLYLFGIVATASQPSIVTTAAASANLWANIYEFSGNPSSLSNIIDVKAVGNGPAATNNSGLQPSAYASDPDDLVFTAVGIGGTSTTNANLSGNFNTNLIRNPGASADMWTSYLIPAASGTYNPFSSWGSSRSWTQITIAFFPDGGARTPAPRSTLGMNYGYTGMPNTYETDMAYLFSAGLRRVRITHPRYTNSTAEPRLMVQAAIDQGMTEIIYGITHGSGSNWDTSTDAAYEAVLQAEGLFMQGLTAPGVNLIFEVDNEGETSRNSGTMTTSAVRVAERAYASYTKGYFTNGKVAYAESASFSPAQAPLWASEGLGALDMVNWNLYGTGTNLAALLLNITTSFGAPNSYITEYGTNGTSGFQEFNNEISWAAANVATQTTILDGGFFGNYFYNYTDGEDVFAIKLGSGSYRYAWPAIQGTKRYFQGVPNGPINR